MKELKSPIDGVKLIELQVFGDDRGSFTESFRHEWLPQEDWTGKVLQANLSRSKKGVLRGLHFHRNQWDFWTCVNGSLQYGLFDLREDSPTCGQAASGVLSETNNNVLFIPPGVAHGFLALEDCTLFYLVNQTYNPDDELGVMWDDPDIDIPWDNDEPPILSPRDQKNSYLKDMSQDEMP